MFAAKVICDSITTDDKRLTTLEVTYPRFIHSEMLTHRAFARNSASSRAIPWEKMRDMIKENPVVPLSFDAEQKGMQSGEPVVDQIEAKAQWIQARNEAIYWAHRLHQLGVHKSICNRLTEPFMWITVIITATEWKNFFRLRCHPAAEKHMQKIAYMMQKCITEHVPKQVDYGDWHLPYITDEDWVEAKRQYGTYPFQCQFIRKVSVGRCARVSYLTHDGKRDLAKDVELHDKLVNPPGDESIMHASPFEHVATPTIHSKIPSGPFRGWDQYRKAFPKENLPG